MATLNKQSCPTCGQSVNEREIALFSGMVRSLLRIMLWCEKEGRYEFSRKEIKHLLKKDSEIAHFGDWILFGGLVYRPEGRGKGHYGINKQRAEDFFAGRTQIPTVIWKNPLNGELRPEKYRTINEIPALTTFLDEAGEYVAKYR
jgi:hypothetical protein